MESSHTEWIHARRWRTVLGTVSTTHHYFLQLNQPILTQQELSIFSFPLINSSQYSQPVLPTTSSISQYCQPLLGAVHHLLRCCGCYYAAAAATTLLLLLRCCYYATTAATTLLLLLRCRRYSEDVLPASACSQMPGPASTSSWTASPCRWTTGTAPRPAGRSLRERRRENKGCARVRQFQPWNCHPLHLYSVAN